jgi:hypothetical protein
MHTIRQCVRLAGLLNILVVWPGYLDLATPLKTFVCQLIRLRRKLKKVWAVPVSLATTSGIVIYFLFFSLLRCFSSGTCRYMSYFIQTRVNWYDPVRVTPFGNLRFKAYLTAPRSLSQSIASFIGILHLGIPYMRLSNFLCIGTN